MNSNKTTTTFSLILRQSVTKRKACPRCSPSCHPGTRWNPMRSACSLRVSWGPFAVSSVTPSIQCTVTAINGVRLGSLHMSMVIEIFPLEFYRKTTTAVSNVHNNEMQVHKDIPPSPLATSPNALRKLPQSVSNCCATGNIRFSELLLEHQKDLV